MRTTAGPSCTLGPADELALCARTSLGERGLRSVAAPAEPCDHDLRPMPWSDPKFSAPLRALHDLVLGTFTLAEFQRWLGHGPNADILPEIAENTSLATFVEEALGALARRGAIDPEFFARMVAEREQKRTEIEAVAALWRNVKPPPPALRAPSRPGVRLYSVILALILTVITVAVYLGSTRTNQPNDFPDPQAESRPKDEPAAQEALTTVADEKKTSGSEATSDPTTGGATETGATDPGKNIPIPKKTPGKKPAVSLRSTGTRIMKQGVDSGKWIKETKLDIAFHCDVDSNLTWIRPEPLDEQRGILLRYINDPKFGGMDLASILCLTIVPCNGRVRFNMENTWENDKCKVDR